MKALIILAQSFGLLIGGVVAAEPYPLKTCLVSDGKLAAGQGKAHAFVYQGKEVRLCCSDCREDFMKEPAKYMAKLKAAGQK